MKKFKHKHPTERWLIFILVMLIGLLVAILWDYGQRISNLEAVQTGPNSQDYVTPQLSYFIQAAEVNLYSNQGVTDPATERVYIPEARIYLPMTKLSRSLFYADISPFDKTPEEFSFNTSLNIHQPLISFKDVTCAQRMAGFSVNKKDTASAIGTKSAGSVTLADKRVLYFYQNENTFCNDYWHDFGANQVVELLKQAKSY